MLQERSSQWPERWKQEGRQESRQEGRQEGRLEGEAHLLIKLLTLKFGSLPEWPRNKLDNASAEQPESWAEGILTTESLEALLGDDT